MSPVKSLYPSKNGFPGLLAATSWAIFSHVAFFLSVASGVPWYLLLPWRALGRWKSQGSFCYQPSGSCWALREQWQGGISHQGTDERAPETHSERRKSLSHDGATRLLSLMGLSLAQDLRLRSLTAEVNFQSPLGLSSRGWMPIVPFWQHVNFVL